MSRPFSRLLLGIAILTLSTVAAFGQEVSPYSRYGLGELESSDFTASRAMGSLGSIYHSPLMVNHTNPASYSFLNTQHFGDKKLATLEAGFRYGVSSLTAKDSTYKTGDGFIDYLTFAFPIGKKIGVSAGLVPFSKMNYNFTQSVADSNAGSYNRFYNGQGRLYEAYLGAGYRVFGADTQRHMLTLGANFNVLFGKMRYSEVINFPDSITYFNTRKNIDSHVTDFIFDIGGQYMFRINRRDSSFFQKSKEKQQDTHLVLGLYGSLPVNHAATIDENFDRLAYTSSNGLSIIDTLSFSATTKQKLNTPIKIGAGIGFDHGFSWQFGVDVNYTIWSGLVDINQEGVKLRNQLRVAIGSEVVPRSEKKMFLYRTFYRLGAYYDGGYITLNGQDIKEYGFTFGLGIPLMTETQAGALSLPYMNLSFSVGSRGTNTANLISERFFRGSVSFTLNGRWFNKYQYD